MNTKTKTVRLNIESDWCKGCEFCIHTCPNNLLGLSEDLNKSGFHYAMLLRPEECTGCGLCAQVCPDMVIQIWLKD